MCIRDRYENETEFPTVESKFNPPTLIYPNTKYCGERFCQSFADLLPWQVKTAADDEIVLTLTPNGLTKFCLLYTSRCV